MRSRACPSSTCTAGAASPACPTTWRPGMPSCWPPRWLPPLADLGDDLVEEELEVLPGLVDGDTAAQRVEVDPGEVPFGLGLGDHLSRGADGVLALGPQLVDGRGVTVGGRADVGRLPARVGSGLVQQMLADLGPRLVRVISHE